MLNIHKKIKVGSPFDKDTFVSAVIDDKVIYWYWYRQTNKNQANKILIRIFVLI